MPAYVVAEVEVTDPEAYKLYADQARVISQSCGGTYLARGGRTETLEGEPPRSRVVVIAFDSVEKARAFYHGRAYQEIVPLRQAASRGRLFVVEGVR